MDPKRFDNLSRVMGEQTGRRGAMKVAAGSALAVLGMGALGQTVLGQDVTLEANKGFKGDSCDNNDDCKQGLICNSNGKCEYKKNCGGKKGNACKNTGDCCKGKNLKCQNKKCKRNN